jgi:hypothetical protein
MIQVQHQTDYTPEILAEYLAICPQEDGKLTYEERYDRWQQLHASCYRDGQWLVSPLDAVLPASLGVFLASERKDWLGAKLLADQYLAHPEIRHPYSGLEVYSMAVMRVIPGVLSGRITETARESLRFFDEKSFGKMSQEFLVGCLQSFSSALMELEPDAEVNADIQQFALDLTSRLEGFQSLDDDVRSKRTNHELQSWIWSVVTDSGNKDATSSL